MLFYWLQPVLTRDDLCRLSSKVGLPIAAKVHVEACLLICGRQETQGSLKIHFQNAVLWQTNSCKACQVNYTCRDV